MKSLGIDTGHYNIEQLFNGTNVNKNKYCLERVQCISLIYYSWVQIKNEQRKNSNEIADIYDIIDKSVSKSYSFNHFVKDYKYIMNNSREILSFSDETKESDSYICKGDKCFIGLRHERDRSKFSKQTFFIQKSNELSDESAHIRSMVTQQILDSSHAYLYHTLRLNTKAIRDRIEQKVNDNNISDISDVLKLCKDNVSIEFRKYLETKKKDARFRNNQEKTQEFSKFVTTKMTTTAAVGKQGSKDENMCDTVCFLGGLLDEMVTYKVHNLVIRDFYEHLESEEWDTDALVMDYANIDIQKDNLIRYGVWSDNKSQIKNVFQFLSNKYSTKYSMKLFDEYLTVFLNANTQYSSGIRFWYWEYYKNITDTVNVLFKRPDGQSFVESNTGYRICDWFIAAKFASFKEEMFENGFCTEEWMETYEKAQRKYEVWKEDDNEEIMCEWQPYKVSNKWSVAYGLKKGEPITISHLMCVLFYTNYTKQSFDFSSSFRRQTWNESDVSLKRRHARFACWARLLRETVECYGENMKYSKVETFYHGIGKELIFEGTQFNICGPLSTTAGLY